METTNPTRCRACLLRDAFSAEEYEKTVLRMWESLSPDVRADETLYEARLARCTACAHLQGGTCMQCGCLVEIRAMRTDSRCPLPEGRW